MGANATGVVARVLFSPKPEKAPRRRLRRKSPNLPRPLLLAAVIVGLLSAATALPIWFDHRLARERALTDAINRLDIVASLAAHEAGLIAGGGPLRASHLEALARALPPLALSQGRTAYLSDESGFLLASAPSVELRPARLLDLFAPQELSRLGKRNGAAAVVSLRDGTQALASIRRLPSGYLAFVQPREAILDADLPAAFAHPLLAALLAAGLLVAGATCLRYRERAYSAGLRCTRMASRLDTSLSRGRCGLFDWDLSQGRVFWSASMFELLGYEPRDEHLTEEEFAATLQSDRGCLRAVLEDTAVSARSRSLDIRARRADGEWLWLRVKPELVRDATNGERHIIAFTSDVTDELGIAERRRAADGRLRDAVEAISEAFVVWDAERRLVLCNSKFLRLYDIPPDAACPGSSFDQVFGAARAPVSARQVEPLAQSEPTGRTFETQLSDGRWMQISERPTKDGGCVSVGTDITALKRNEARLKERERHLRGSVREAETEKQRLAMVAERHIEASHAKTEFLARMSHELRTPLNAILGFADMMRNEVLGPLGCQRYSEYTHDIHASGMQLLAVIDGILQMSRLERGQVRLAPELLDLCATIDETLAEVQREVEAKRLAVVVDLVEPALLHADRRALQEILLQLLRNAVCFTLADGLVRIRVRPSGRGLNIFIEDTGIGIGADLLPSLGRAFEQVEAEYCRSGTGAGLGLAIARALTELHGGSLRIRSQPGLGTVVLVAIPRVQPAANDGPSPEEPSHLRLVAAE